MTEFELAKAIKHLRPSSQFSFTGNDYSTIKWDVLEGEAPTMAQLESALVAVTASEQAEAAAKESAKAALLAKLGITADEAALLLG
jgi:hypothetical protein